MYKKPLLYEELYADAKILVEKEQEEYAREKIMAKLRKINDLINRRDHLEKEIKKNEEDLADLRTHKVGHTPPNWHGRSTETESFHTFHKP